MEKSNKNLSLMYKDWFLDYASYVILERAIPSVNDGLKPVQKRILHSMHEMHDGRYHKVANIIGYTMQYHPHGDAAIGDALVSLGQKDILIDTQGNWGDVRTGDSSAAPRYIEARLSKFSLAVLFNKHITQWKPSYDGRKNEPVSLPVRFPLVLTQGVEGIAVGLSTKILPHNFNELIKSSIGILNDKPFKILPDFQTGGMIDPAQYNKGKRGGRVRVRSYIDIVDKVTLRIRSIPYSVTTVSLIDSIIKANESGKIKIKHIEDNTAENIDIVISLIKGTSPNVTVDALYAFTNCEISISPNCCVIVNNRPEFISVDDLLKISTSNTVNLLKEDLLHNLSTLEKQWHKLTLEKIFIENKIYRDIEDCKTWESIISVISNAIKPFKNLLKLEVSDEDIALLTEIKIKRITKYNSLKEDEKLSDIEKDIKETKNNINHIKEYSIRYFEYLLKKFGKGRERKTEITSFDSISVRRVAVADQKLFFNKDGFIGTSLKDGEYVCKCSKLDNIIVILKDGTLIVTKVEDKKYIGKNILYTNVWKKNDRHMIYNLAYIHSKNKYTYIKRFAATSVIIDKVYNIAGKNSDNEILYFTANPNSEAEIVSVSLHFSTKARTKSFDYDYSDLAIKGRDAIGNILSKYRVRKVTHKQKGESTLGGRKLWLDENIGRLNIDERGQYLGSFNLNDKILIIYNEGSYEMTNFDLSNRYKMSDIKLIEKFNKDSVITMLYYNGKMKNYFVKRFLIETSLIGKKFILIPEFRGSRLILATSTNKVDIKYNYRTKSGDKKEKSIINSSIVDVKGWKTIGNKLDDKLRMSGFKFSEILEDTTIEEDSSQNLESNEETENLTLF